MTNVMTNTYQALLSYLSSIKPMPGKRPDKHIVGISIWLIINKISKRL